VIRHERYHSTSLLEAVPDIAGKTALAQVTEATI
jgi:hypothetical protein